MREYLLYGHIFFGFTALLIGIIPMVAKKGSRLHNQTGLIYFYAMAGVFLTAMPLSIMSYNFFLYSIGIFSFYSAFTGFRFARRKNRAFTIVDKFSAIAIGFTGLGMVSYALYMLLVKNSYGGIVLGVFGFLALLGFIEDYRAIWRPSPKTTKQDWIFGHIGRIGGSYIAAITAFLVSNSLFEAVPPMVNWLLPTVIGAALISRSTQVWKAKFA